jgi:hypothetical protein
MKSQKCRLATILILAVSLLPFSFSGLGAGQVTPDQEALVDLMKPDQPLEKAVGRALLGKAKKGLAQQIADDFETMKLLFENKEFSSLAKLLGKRGATLTTPRYEKICGGASAEFWRSVWNEGLELNFVPVSVVFSGAIKSQPVPFCAAFDQGISIREWKKDPGFYDATAVLTFEFHIVPKTSGKTSQNDTGVAAAIYLHKNGCPWG